MILLENYKRIIDELKPYRATLVAVSKLKPVEDIGELMKNGQKIFGENYVQELLEKRESLPDAKWHFIGHLQSNKVKSIAPFISLVHGVDSLSLFNELNKEAAKHNRKLECLLQVFIAKEETKFGFDYSEAEKILTGNELKSLKNISVSGLMGMATATDDEKLIRDEFRMLKIFFDRFRSDEFSILSMGMTSDYKIALDEGSNMVRIGSAIFGERK